MHVDNEYRQMNEKKFREQKSKKMTLYNAAAKESVQSKTFKRVTFTTTSAFTSSALIKSSSSTNRTTSINRQH